VDQWHAGFGARHGQHGRAVRVDQVCGGLVGLGGVDGGVSGGVDHDRVPTGDPGVVHQVLDRGTDRRVAGDVEVGRAGRTHSADAGTQCGQVGAELAVPTGNQQCQFSDFTHRNLRPRVRGSGLCHVRGNASARRGVLTIKTGFAGSAGRTGLDAETGPDSTTESSGATVLVLPSRPSTGSRVLFGFGRSLVTLAAVGVLAVTGYNWTALHNLNQGIARTDVFGNNKVAPTSGNNAPVVPPLTSDVNILLVGLDSRTDPHGKPAAGRRTGHAACRSEHR